MNRVELISFLMEVEKETSLWSPITPFIEALLKNKESNELYLVFNVEGRGEIIGLIWKIQLTSIILGDVDYELDDEHQKMRDSRFLEPYSLQMIDLERIISVGVKDG